MDDLQIPWDRLDEAWQASVAIKGKARPGPEWFTLNEYAIKFGGESPLPPQTARNRLLRLIDKGLIEKRKSYPTNFYRAISK